MKVPQAVLLVLIAMAMAAVDAQEDSHVSPPTLPGLQVDQPPLAAAPSPSMRKSFTLADLKDAPVDPVASSDITGVEETASMSPLQAKPTPQPTNAHQGLADLLSTPPSPTVVTSSLSMPRGRLPSIDDGDQVGKGVRGGHEAPVVVQRKNHYHHPWGPPPHYAPQQYGPPRFGPVLRMPPPFVITHFAPSQWTSAGPQWVPLPQAGPQWLPMPPGPAVSIPEPPVVPPSATDSQPSSSDPDTARLRQAFRMHIGAKGNGMEAFLQAMIKAMSGMKSDAAAVPAAYQSPDSLADEVANPSGRQQQQGQVQDDPAPADANGDASPPNYPQPTPASTGLSKSTAPDPFAFTYSPPPETPARTVRVTAPPYDVEHAELTNENLAEHKFSPAGLTEAPPS